MEQRHIMHDSSVNNLLLSLEECLEIVPEFINTIPGSELNAKRRPDFWTIRHHVYHLADVQKLFHDRLVLFKNEKNPVIARYVPGAHEEKKPGYASVTHALAAYQELRRMQIDLLKTFGMADFLREGTHPEYKKYTPLILARHILSHDYWHLYRIEELWLTKDEYLS